MSTARPLKGRLILPSCQLVLMYMLCIVIIDVFQFHVNLDNLIAESFGRNIQRTVEWN